MDARQTQPCKAVAVAQKSIPCAPFGAHGTDFFFEAFGVRPLGVFSHFFELGVVELGVEAPLL